MRDTSTICTPPECPPPRGAPCLGGKGSCGQEKEGEASGRAHPLCGVCLLGIRCGRSQAPVRMRVFFGCQIVTTILVIQEKTQEQAQAKRKKTDIHEIRSTLAGTCVGARVCFYLSVRLCVCACLCGSVWVTFTRTCEEGRGARTRRKKRSKEKGHNTVCMSGRKGDAFPDRMG